MPFPLLFPLASFVAKATIGKLIATTVVATTVVNATNDAYQKVNDEKRKKP